MFVSKGALATLERFPQIKLLIKKNGHIKAVINAETQTVLRLAINLFCKSVVKTPISVAIIINVIPIEYSKFRFPLLKINPIVPPKVRKKPI